MREIYIKLIAFGLFFVLSSNVFAQYASIQSNPEKFQEKVYLITDRETYTVGEILNFKAFNLSNDELKKVEWSKVLYVEFITCDGKSVFKSKFKFGANGADGSIEIPKEIVTGNYYLRAYTKWMRNYSNKLYFYKPISIINPYYKQLVQKPEFLVSDFKLDTIAFESLSIEYSFYDTIIKSNSQVSFKVLPKSTATKQNLYELLVDGKKTMVNKNELDKIMNSGASELAYESHDSFYSTISIVRNIKKNNRFIQPQPLDNNLEFNFEYIPETRGVSISGTLINSDTKKPLALKKVHISVFNGSTETQSVITDSLGKFIFAVLDQMGDKEIFISAENVADNQELLVDNDFCAKPINLPYIPFVIDPNQREYYNVLIKNGQIEKQYSHVKSAPLVDSTERQVFYNTTNTKIVFDDYVEMPTIEDYIKELMPSIIIHKNKKKTSFEVYGKFSELKLYAPLVLFNSVIVTDIDKLMAVDAKKIESVESLSYPYIMGDFIYGGVINILSKSGAINDINLENSGLFFNYSFLYNLGLVNKTEVILANTLLWKSDVLNEIGKSNKHEFSTGYNKGIYQVVCTKVDENGTVSRYLEEIDIK
ncbi:MAG: hypothetical protein PF517_16750 [Salinivirgaceae bacterium]|nr:hypothetical protein [Salinivirgaceae bacterium]